MLLYNTVHKGVIFLKEIKSVFLFVNFEKEKIKEQITFLANFLTKNDVGIFMSDEFQDEFCDFKISFGATQKVILNCDAILSIGGDGTIIRAAKMAIKYKKPIFGVNLGRLGFLASFEPGQTQVLEQMIKGEYNIDKRMVLEVRDKSRTFYAINDAVITRATISRMIDIDVFCGKNKVTSTRADGIIFATPTGSTAYSLSAGGPIIDPALECILTTPICPHSLSTRTIVFSSDAILKAKIDSNNCEKAYLTIDGQEAVEIDSEHTLEVFKSDVDVFFIMPKEKTFFDTLNKKML